jgi:hypothetical protein
MSGGNFASLTVGLLVRKPSSIMMSQTFPLARRVAPAPVDAPIPARPSPRSKQRQLPALSTVADLPAKPSRMSVQLSAAEYEALGLVAVKKGTTPQHVMRNALRDFLVEFVEQCRPLPLHPIRLGSSRAGIVTRGRAGEQTVPYPSGLPCS